MTGIDFNIVLPEVLLAANAMTSEDRAAVRSAARACIEGRAPGLHLEFRQRAADGSRRAATSSSATPPGNPCACSTPSRM